MQAMPPSQRHAAALVVVAIVVVTTLLLAPGREARANAVEDIFGAGARTQAMGGAGTAVAHDFSAVYYNPGNLALCDRSRLTVGMHRIGYGLHAQTPQDAPVETDPLRGRDALALGVCTPLPLGLSFGMLLDLGTAHPQFFDQWSPNSKPSFALYGQRLEQVSVMGAVAYEIFEGLSLGLGGSALVNSTLSLLNDVPVLGEEEVVNNYSWQLEPASAFYGGVQYMPLPWLRLGAAYRSTLYHKLEAHATTRVEVTGVPFDLEHLLESVAWFSPQQAALGIAVQTRTGLTLGVDATWYDWSAYPGPYIKTSPLAGSDVAASLNYAPVEPIDFRDIVVPRLGIEYEWHRFLAARLGYSYRPTPSPARPQGRGALLDANAHFVSIGGGIGWGEPDRDERARASAAHTTNRAAITDAKRGSTLAGMSVRADVYITLGYLPDTTLQHTAIEPSAATAAAATAQTVVFGGLAYDAGIALTAGF